MNKAVIVAVLGLVALASAEMRIETPLKSFLKPKALLAGNLGKPGEPAVWGECTSTKQFKPDMSKTYSDPKIPVKGIDVALILHGTFTDDVELKGIKIYVEWNKTPLYVQDYERAASYSEGDDYSDNIGWSIPSFAPTGHYNVVITLHDAANKNLGCLTVDFDL